MVGNRQLRPLSAARILVLVQLKERSPPLNRSLTPRKQPGPSWCSIPPLAAR